MTDLQTAAAEGDPALAVQTADATLTRAEADELVVAAPNPAGGSTTQVIGTGSTQVAGLKDRE